MGKVIARFGIKVQSGGGEPVIYPIVVGITDLDRLAWTSHGPSVTEAPGGTGAKLVHTVPEGERWIFQGATMTPNGTWDFRWAFVIAQGGSTMYLQTAVTAITASAPETVTLEPGWKGTVLFPGDQVIIQIDAWTNDTGGNTSHRIWYIREECSSS